MYRALRGVCVSPGKHLMPGETTELDKATAQFLVSIKAVEEVVEPKDDEPKTESAPAPKGTGKKEK